VNALLEAAEFTPLSIAIDASHFSFYASGVLHLYKPYNLNHGVQVVGFNKTDPTDPYLLIRNSWGPRWGINGYLKVSTVDNGGAALAASYPFIEGMKIPGVAGCNSGEKPDAAKNCLCTYGEPCDKSKPHGKDEDGCDDDCGCGEFRFCR
jgi:hypothetical protein